MLGIGGFTPLDGFMTHADWEGVCDDFRTADGLFWPIPITLSVDATTADAIGIGRRHRARRSGDDGDVLAMMTVTEKYSIDKAHECLSVFRTTDLEHPGVKMVMQQGDVNLAGPVQVLSDGGFKAKYGALFMTPARNARRIRAARLVARRRVPDAQPDASLARVPRQGRDRGLRRRAGAFAARQPEAGRHSGRGAHARDRGADREILRAGTVVQAGYPLDMRYAGPREALLHALFRQNYGCSHQIVGRDHAGVGKLLRPVRRAPHLRRDPAGALETQPIKIDWTFWCYACGGMASGAHLPARREGPAAGVGHQAAQMAVGRQRGAAGIFAAGSARDPARLLRGVPARGSR